VDGLIGFPLTKRTAQEGEPINPSTDPPIHRSTHYNRQRAFRIIPSEAKKHLHFTFGGI